MPVMGHGGGGWPGAINYNMHHLKYKFQKSQFVKMKQVSLLI